MPYSLKDGNKIIELQAEIDRLKAENAELKQREDIWVETATKNARLLTENAALRAEAEKHKGARLRLFNLAKKMFRRALRAKIDNGKLRTQLAKYKEALEWYGDEGQYERNIIEHEDENGKTVVWYPVIIDGGQRAREAVK